MYDDHPACIDCKHLSMEEDDIIKVYNVYNGSNIYNGSNVYNGSNRSNRYNGTIGTCLKRPRCRLVCEDVFPITAQWECDQFEKDIPDYIKEWKRNLESQ